MTATILAQFRLEAFGSLEVCAGNTLHLARSCALGSAYEEDPQLLPTMASAAMSMHHFEYLSCIDSASPALAFIAEDAQAFKWRRSSVPTVPTSGQQSGVGFLAEQYASSVQLAHRCMNGR